MNELYNRIEFLGKSRGYKNMTVLCKAAGVSRSVMSELNAGRSKDISKPNAQKFADLLGVSLDDIYGIEKEKAPTLTPKDERDIERRLSEVLEELERGQDGLMFSGETMDETTRELLAASLRNSMEIGKTLAKKKYTPKNIARRTDWWASK